MQDREPSGFARLRAAVWRLLWERLMETHSLHEQVDADSVCEGAADHAQSAAGWAHPAQALQAPADVGPAWFGDATGVGAAPAGAPATGDELTYLLEDVRDATDTVAAQVELVFHQRATGLTTLKDQAGEKDVEQTSWFATLALELAKTALGMMTGGLGGALMGAVKEATSSAAVHLVAGTVGKLAEAAILAAPDIAKEDAPEELHGINPRFQFASMQQKALNREELHSKLQVIASARSIVHATRTMPPSAIHAEIDALYRLAHGIGAAGESAAATQFHASLGAWCSYLAQSALGADRFDAADLSTMSDLSRIGREGAYDEERLTAEGEGTVSAQDAVNGVVDVRVVGMSPDEPLEPQSLSVKGLNAPLRAEIERAPTLSSMALPVAVHGRVYWGSRIGVVTIAMNAANHVTYDADDDGKRYLAAMGAPEKYGKKTDLKEYQGAAGWAEEAIDLAAGAGWEKHAQRMHFREEMREEEAAVADAHRLAADDRLVAGALRAERRADADTTSDLGSDAQLGATMAMSELATMSPGERGKVYG